MDRIDEQILNLIKGNARMSYQEILSPERQAKFLKDVVEMNTIRRPDIE